MERSQRVLIFLTFFICTACLALLTTALSTHNWIVSRPIRSLVAAGGGEPLNASLLLQAIESDDRKFRGEIYFGLFQGTKRLNYGLGDRTGVVWVKQEMLRNTNFGPFIFWLMTIIFSSIGMIFGLFGAIFAITNTVMTPVEMLTGRLGLFIWNGLSGFFCALAFLAWSMLYWQHFRASVMTKEEQKDGWTSEGRTRLGYSCYLVLATVVLDLANIWLIWRAGRPLGGSSRPHRTGIDKQQPEGLIMLY